MFVEGVGGGVGGTSGFRSQWMAVGFPGDQRHKEASDAAAPQITLQQEAQLPFRRWRPPLIRSKDLSLVREGRRHRYLPITPTPHTTTHPSAAATPLSNWTAQSKTSSLRGAARPRKKPG